MDHLIQSERRIDRNFSVVNILWEKIDGASSYLGQGNTSEEVEAEFVQVTVQLYNSKPGGDSNTAKFIDALQSALLAVINKKGISKWK